MKNVIFLGLIALVASGTVAAKKTTSRSELVDRIVINPIIEPDVDCRETGHQDIVELFSWQIFSKLNSPIYYNQMTQDQAFWGSSPSWEMQGPNTAPYWSLWFNQSDFKNISPPYLRHDQQWQCGEGCLINYPPVDESPEDDTRGDVPLIDAQGNTVRYEIRINRPWLYSTQNFLKENQTDTNPGNYFNLGKCGTFSRTSEQTGSLINVPAVMIKLAWKKLTSDEDATRYITFTEGDSTWGLAAMHIAAKTTKAWMWIWSTFEHRNNFKGYRYNNKNVAAGFRKMGEACRSDPCGTPLEPNNDQSKIVAKYNALLQREFLKVRSPLSHYKMLGVQYASFDILSKDQVPTYDQDMQACQQRLAASGPHPPFFVSDNQAHIYSYNVAKTACKTVQKIVTPKLFNPLFEPFPATPPKQNYSCISCHVDAEIIDKPKLFNTFSDFSFTPSHYGIPNP